MSAQAVIFGAEDLATMSRDPYVGWLEVFAPAR
jgi:hypothetical protein